MCVRVCVPLRLCVGRGHRPADRGVLWLRARLVRQTDLGLSLASHADHR